ncbi:DNA-directed RNA polymerases I, II, and III subunit RPABC4 [Nematocida displodere]|uniref:DNA-directed RNA polymerases I, II, and III subunit RPABC4 n=1 Tax=Nematocida displodere TaxID=1805483 RepID=A0A177EJY7_9MICR|nr:DNA-directed RNA polymerases I, II, and III subunit RPABC4 [Nematocida displodere]
MNDDVERKHEYQCGECKLVVVIGARDPIKCLTCGHRILYKKRSNTWTQYEAR